MCKYMQHDVCERIKVWGLVAPVKDKLRFAQRNIGMNFAVL